MMKQEAKTQSKKWLWLVVALAALAAVIGLVLAFVLPKESQTGTPDTPDAEVKLYWNVDGAKFIDLETGLSVREPGEDGLYHIRFALDGQLVELAVSGDKQLINYIDAMGVMGLQLDADGVVVDALDPKTVATEIVKEQFVKKAEDNTIVINSSIAMNGMETVITISGQTRVYDVSPQAQVTGQPGTCAPLDKVTVYADAAGNVTHVFIVERAVEAGVYWRVDRYYNAALGQTSRKPDENGAYTMLFAHNGEQVELKCKNKELVNLIDAGNVMYAEFAFVLDEEGYIVQSVNVGSALSGMIGCNTYNITALDGNTFTAERWLEGGNQGSTYSATVGPDCDIFLVENGCEAEFAGQRVSELKLGDRITCYTDTEGKPLLIFVINRLADSPMYYSAERMYDDYTKQTTRKPDSNGYYVYRMAAQGKELTVRTKDKAIATKMDSFTGQCMGLKLSGSTVEAVYDPNCVCGAWPVGEKRYVTALSGTVATLAAWSDLDLISNCVIPQDCVIYDVTGYPGVKFGSKTQLQMYDRVQVYQDIAYNLTHIFVLERYVESAKIYYNTSRLYSSQTKATARIPDADGYYLFNMCCEGKEVQVKTKNKDMATFIDYQNAPIVALEVKNGVVKAAYPAIAAEKYSYKQLNTNYIGKIDKDGTIHAYYYDGGKRYERINTFKMAANCKVYNVSTYYQKNRGEKTTLQVDDQVQAIATNPKGELVQIFILKRKLDAPLYWKTEQKYNATTGETTRVPDAEGWYIFDLAVNGEVKQFKTKDKAIATAVDKENQAFTIKTNGDVILGAYSPIVAKDIRDYTAGNFDVMALSGSKATVKRNQPTASNFGTSYDITFAKGCKFYDVSPYAANFGAPATLQVGDRVTGLINEQGEVAYCYIVYKNTRKAGPMSLCDHCGKEVFWEPYTGPVAGMDVHYYLTHDMTRSAQLAIGSAAEGAEKNDIVFDLNGHTLTMEKRGFLVYSNLSIMDSAGGGRVVSGDADGSHGGVAMVLGSGTLQVYGGTLTQSAAAPVAKFGGVLYITDQAALNLYGGTVTGGKAATGANIYLTLESSAELSGGTVDGGIYAATKGTVTLSGAPKLSGIQLAAGVKLTLAELTEGAQILVTANGAFTNPNDKTGDYAAYFAPENPRDVISLQDNVLVYTKTPVDMNAISTESLSFAPGTSEALCPICDRKVVWTAAAAEKSIYPGDGAHYYLPEDITFDGTADAYFLSPTNGTACLHLNGHNITATAQKAIAAYGGTLNVMGSGTVSGNYAVAWSGGATVHATGGGKLNLCGGTFVKPVTNTTANPIVFAANGTINMFGGATVDGTGIPGTYTATGVMVEHANAVFNLYGGTVKNGVALGTGGNIRLSSGKLNISGGTVDGGDVYTGVSGSITLSGAPVIGELKLPAGVKILLGELTQGADITVSAEGVFTETNSKAADYAAYFKPAGEDGKIEVQDNALKYVVSVAEQPAFDNSNLVFAAGTTNALCPACNKTVTWQAISGQLTSTKWLQADGHYYLSGDVTYAGTDQALYSPTGAVTKTACLHLNGHNITASAGKAIHCGDGTLNILGNGKVSGSGTAYGGATIHTWGNGKLNIYGGTYTKGASSYPVIFVGSYTVNLYDGAVVEGLGTVPGPYALVYLESNGAVFNMHGGVIRNGSSTGTCGNLKAYQGTINLLGGLIQNGTGNTGGNIHIYNTGKLNISGGEVKNGSVYVAVSGAATVSGAPVIGELKLPTGVKITLVELTSGADITVAAEGIFTEANEKAADYTGYFTPADPTATIEAQGNVLTYQNPA